MNPDSEYPPRMIRGIKRKEWANDAPPYRSAFFFDESIRKDGSVRCLYTGMIARKHSTFSGPKVGKEDHYSKEDMQSY